MNTPNLSPENPPRKGFSPTLLLFLFLPLLGIFAAFMLILSDQAARVPAYVAPPTPAPVMPLPTRVSVIDAPVIDFELPVLGSSNRTARLTDYEGRIVFLNFWATWCEPCERELPAFMQFTEEHADDPNAPIILSVNYGESIAEINIYLAEQGISGLNVLLDSDIRVAQSYGVFQLPVTFVIDERGIVRYPKFGEMRYQDLQAYIDALS
jgi:thiol-disulfide isomerase/thioredoxin